MSHFSANLQALLRVLSDGEWHSGEELGERLSVSRAAIAKQLKALEGLALSLESRKGVGYRLDHGLDLLSEETILDSLSSLLSPAESFSGVLHLHSEIDSTNQFLMNRFRHGQSVHGHICLAERQSAGRGRRGRRWHSPFAQHIYLSLAWRFDGIAAMEGLSLAVGVIICEALKSFGVTEVQLKWPNDVLWRDRKLGGVLIELAGDAVSDCLAVIGIGLNVSAKSSEAIDQPWVGLQELGVSESRNMLAGALIHSLSSALERYPEGGFQVYQDRWNALSAFDKKRVTLLSPSGALDGRMVGVSRAGALCLEVDGRLQEFIGGELSLREQ